MVHIITFFELRQLRRGGLHAARPLAHGDLSTVQVIGQFRDLQPPVG